ncbi:hypothetical protein QR680_005090 [Steinernema hermaphroditum]|uniref:Delta-like protein n=1 Tax=Steinernema hermaphroditum TaxID=289476 RepID=A0AA39HT41_9BILA|nr:hypothetical protein QR680_005090 [Steinernema hermaphroditum]
MFAPHGRLALLLILLSSYSSLISAAGGTLNLEIKTWSYERPSCCVPGKDFSFGCDCELFLRLCIGFLNDFSAVHRDCSVAHLSHVDLRMSQRLRVPFKGRWLGSNQKLIAEVISDQTGRVVDRIERSTTVFPRNASRLRVQQDFAGSHLDYEFTVECDEHYFGNDCGRYCFANSQTACTPEGKHVCREGWTGDKCLTPVCKDGCLHGVCAKPNTCRCEAGWTGPQCTECVPHKNCVHGTCQKPFSCVCERNWGGEWCDKDLDVCQRKSPCKNGGRCTTEGRQDYYVCNCTGTGFEGKDCEIPITHLEPEKAKCDCGVHGKCLPGGGCECVDGFEGDLCERKTPRPSIPDVCLMEDGSLRANGAKWMDLDCRQCSCSQGKVECSEARCEHRDCVRHFGICPFDQTCVGLDHAECLKGDCPSRVGFCKPWSHTSLHGVRANCDGKRESEECSRFFLEFDFAHLEAGTTVDAVCHHLALTLFAERLTNYAFECRRSGSRAVQVNMMSVQRDFHIGKVKRGLVEKLRHNATHSAVLRGVVRVVEFDGDALMAWERAPVAVSSPATTTTNALIAVVAVLLFVIAALLGLSLWRWRQMPRKAEDARLPQPETKVAFLRPKGADAEELKGFCPEVRLPPPRCPTPPPDYYTLHSAKRPDPENLV